MSATTTTTSTPATTSVRRTLGLARWNAVLLTRNTLALVYAVALPFLGFAFLLGGERGDVGPGVAAVSMTLVAALLFPGYYNLLSQFVTRRDELVLKRLRTGESRDLEIVVAMALPGATITAGIALIAVPVAMAAGQEAPLNPVVYAVTVVMSVALLAAFALWTAAWTRNAEAAQITSFPVFMLLVVGQMSIGFPDAVQRWTDLTPGAALTDLVRSGWFGLPDEGTVPTLSFGDTWAAAGQPLLVLAAWTAFAAWLAVRSLRWEPRV